MNGISTRSNYVQNLLKTIK